MKMKGIYSKRTKQAVGTITLLVLLAGVVAMLPIKAHSGDVGDVITEDAITEEAEVYLPEGTLCHRRNGQMECGIPDKKTGDLVWVESEFNEEVASNKSTK